MAALSDGERAVPDWTTQGAEPAIPFPAEPAMPGRVKRRLPAWLMSRQFIATIVAIGGVQLMAAMDGPVVVFALPKIQNELNLSDSGLSWVITAYVLTFGGLIILGGRLGDAFGRKRIFIVGVAMFTFASVLCSIAWDGDVLVMARLLHGASAAIVTPTCVTLLATTFPTGPARNAAAGVFGATGAVGSAMGLVLGGAVTNVSWRLAFLLNVPIGVVVLWTARTMLRETQKERMKLDAAGAVLATLICIGVVFGLAMGPEKGWGSATTIGSALLLVVAAVAFVVVERRAENPVVPFNLFSERSRLATFGAMFLAHGVIFTLTVLIALYVQNIMGYSPLRAATSFIPFAIAMAVGVAVASRLVTWFSPRVMVLSGGTLVLGAMAYGSMTFSGGMPYFPNLVLPIVVGAVGLGMVTVPLALSMIASVGFDRIGPASAITVMLQSLGGALMLVIVQVVITLRTLYLGGTSGPVKTMTPAQLHALDRGYAYGMLWLAGVVVLLGAVALLIGYTAKQVAHAQKASQGVDGEGT